MQTRAILQVVGGH